MRRLCTICARGGSKGLPNKNLRPIGGRPMMAWTIMQARATGLFEQIVVSSDALPILDAAREAGVDAVIERPAELATDTADKAPAIRHAILEAERQFGVTFDVVADLDVTAPLRLPQDIVGAVELLETSGAASVITGAPAHRSPYFNLVERSSDGTVRLAKQPDRPILRRQDAPPCFDMNASIYVWQRDNFIADPRVFYPDTVLYEMPSERSHDVDSDLDFFIVEILFERLHITNHLNSGQPT
jgi:CMP-N,N'-diacetyllegionaminic acid synthase